MLSILLQRAWLFPCLLLAAHGAAAQTRLISVSRAAQAVVIEHQGELLVLRAANRKPQFELVIEQVDDRGAEIRFTGLPGADVIARAGRGADLAAMRSRFSAPRNTQNPPGPPDSIKAPVIAVEASTVASPTAGSPQ